MASPFSSIEITIAGQRFVLKGDGDENHLREVAELVKRKVEGMKKKSPALSLYKAAMLAAFDFASYSIKGRKKALDYKANILNKAGLLLENMQGELGASKTDAKPL